MSHPKPNFSRMMKVIDEVFATRKDPDQLQVTPQQLKKLEKIHPATLSELSDDNGPLIWVLVIPTTTNVMREFVKGNISEKELLERTNPGDSYECIYLCSASTLPEIRSKGKTKKLCLEAINAIRKDHPVKTLFVWPFTREGNALAETLAKECGLKLLKRSGH
ncbi:MAG: hypothetical protein ACXVO9_13390 [Bacteroidia bacterium]